MYGPFDETVKAVIRKKNQKIHGYRLALNQLQGALAKRDLFIRQLQETIGNTNDLLDGARRDRADMHARVVRVEAQKDSWAEQVDTARIQVRFIWVGRMLMFIGGAIFGAFSDVWLAWLRAL